jgi:CNT family concentrative nucleoside transporter
MDILHGIFGLSMLTLIAWSLSEARSQVTVKVIAAGIGLQLILAIILLKMPGSQQLFLALNSAVMSIQQATEAGTGFVFGYLGGGSAPFAITDPSRSFILAFQALPLVLVVSALSALLFHWRVLPVVVNAMSWLLQKSLGIGGALGLSAAANIFIGMVEAPLLVRPYLKLLSRSELFALMSCGMATIAGTVMVLYGAILGYAIPNAMGHILLASLISAPAALMIARIMIPEAKGFKAADASLEIESSSAMDAITRGTVNGLQLLLNIIAMLIVFVALVHLANQIIGLLPAVNGEALSLQRLLGWIMAPLVWLIGIPWSEAQAAGALMGIKTVLNEFLAYMQLAQTTPEILSPRSQLIMTYAMCGFANFGSLGIMIGGLGVMVPERRAEIVSLGMKSLLSGTLATLMTGAVAGMVL